MIKEAYCSLEVAELLKGRGFDIPCRTWYNTETSEPIFCNDVCNNFIDANLQYYKVSAPTHQMAMAWLREVHKLHIGIARSIRGYHISIETIPLGVVKYITREIVGTNYVETYEEAVEEVLKYVLENLI